jgi:hypothetical protein
MRELIQSMRLVSKELPRELAKLHKTIGEPVAQAAARKVRSRSGRLARDIRTLGSQRQAQVAVGRKLIPYAGVNHYGWPGRFEGNPFLTDALAEQNMTVLDRYNQTMEDLIDRISTGVIT